MSKNIFFNKNCFPISYKFSKNEIFRLKLFKIEFALIITIFPYKLDNS